MAMDGTDFVAHAYATILHRDADKAGLASYLTELNSGTEKIAILRALASSPEAQALGIAVPGLDDLLDAKPSHQGPRKRWFWNKESA
jgi:hypothetical protein